MTSGATLLRQDVALRDRAGAGVGADGVGGGFVDVVIMVSNCECSVQPIHYLDLRGMDRPRTWRPVASDRKPHNLNVHSPSTT